MYTVAHAGVCTTKTWESAAEAEPLVILCFRLSLYSLQIKVYVYYLI